MAGLHTHSIQTVTAKVHLSQSSVLGNTFLEDTPVTTGVCDKKKTVTFSLKRPAAILEACCCI